MKSIKPFLLESTNVPAGVLKPGDRINTPQGEFSVLKVSPPDREGFVKILFDDGEEIVIGKQAMLEKI